VALRSDYSDERVWLRPVEAARAMGISRSFVYVLIHNGELPAVRVHRRWLVPYSAVLPKGGLDGSAFGSGTASGLGVGDGDEDGAAQ